MTVLQIIVSLITSIAYVFLIALCIVTFQYMRRQQRFIENMGEAVAKTYALMSAMSIQSDVDKLNDMERQKRSLVDGEHYEQAQQLQQLIERQQQKIMRAVEKMRQTFGDSIEISVEHIKSND